MQKSGNLRVHVDDVDDDAEQEPVPVEHERARQPGGEAAKGFVRKLFRVVWAIINGFFRVISHIALFTAVTALCGILVVFLGFGALYVRTMGDLDDITDYTKVPLPQDSTIYDMDDEVIGVISTSKSNPVAFGEISQPAKDAVVCIEDERFYNHPGIDWQGILRALKYDFESWSSGSDATQGASTITQQYVRNAYKEVGTERTIDRKLKEMMLAAQLEGQMSKDDILNAYLNTVYYGNGCYGIDAASQYYFGHPASKLDYYESAILAAVINGPAIYDPATEEGRAATQKRANLVLDKMYSLGKLGGLTQDDLRALKKTDINKRLHITEKEHVIAQPYYYDYVMSVLKDEYTKDEIAAGGWQIHTTLSIAEGEKATEIAKAVERDYGRGITASIAEVDSSTGAIRVLMGGTDYKKSQFNIATQSIRQNGSTLKPIMYAAMCEYQGYFVTDQLPCDPIDIAGPGEQEHWITPYLKHSPATMQEGIVISDNAMAIRAAGVVGMQSVQRMATACNMEGSVGDNAAAIIGGQSIGFTPLQMAQGYQAFAHDGISDKVWCIETITDKYGNLVYEHEQKESEAMSKETAREITRALVATADSHHMGYRKKHSFACKTGTTDDRADIWCVGYNGTRTVALWMGNKDARIDVDTSDAAVARLDDYMNAVGQNDPDKKFDAPQFKLEVPKPLKNETADAYVMRLRAKRFNVEYQYVSAEKQTDNGRIVKVDGEGEMRDRGSSVIVTVARNQITVPNCVNKSLEDAASACSGLSLSLKMEYDPSGRAVPTVTAQSIDAGSSVSEGTPITLTVRVPTKSAKTTQEQVPFQASDDALKGLQDKVDSLTKERDTLQEKLDAETDDDDKDIGSKVPVPDVQGLTLEQADRVLSSCRLYASYSGPSDAIVTSVTPAVGTYADSESTVTLTAEERNEDENEESPENTEPYIDTNRDDGE